MDQTVKDIIETAAARIDQTLLPLKDEDYLWSLRELNRYVDGLIQGKEQQRGARSQQV